MTKWIVHYRIFFVGFIWIMFNAKKTKWTKCIEFSLRNVKKHNFILVIKWGTLYVSESAIFLGLTIDPKLQWHTHLESLADKLSSVAFVIKKVRQMTDVETTRLIYYSYLHSILSYGMLLWGSASDINSIFILQKRAVTYIYNLRARDSLRDRHTYFIETNIEIYIFLVK